MNEQRSVTTIVNLCPDFFSLEKIAGPSDEDVESIRNNEMCRLRRS